MKKNVLLNFRIEEQLKDDFAEIVESQGFTVSEVLTASIRDIVIRKKIPINIYDINKKLITTTKSVKQCISYMKENFGIAICDERINKQCKTPEVPYEGYYFEYANVNNYLSDIIRQIN